MDADIQNILDGIAKLPNALIISYQAAGQTAFAIINERIQEHGLAHDGTPLATIRPYSKTYLAFKSNPPPNTGIKNRYRGFVDYTLTGQMWANIHQKSAQVDENTVQIVIGADRAENQKKMDNISFLWEDMFLMGDSEIENTALVLDEEFQKQLDAIWP